MDRVVDLSIAQVQKVHQYSPIETLICEWRIETIQGLAGSIVSSCGPELRLYNAALVMTSDCCNLPLAVGPGNRCSACGEWGFHRIDGEPAMIKVVRGIDVYSSLVSEDIVTAESELRVGQIFANWLTAFLGDELEAAVESTLIAHEIVKEIFPAIVDPERIFHN